MNWSLISAVNNDDVLSSCLLSSLDVSTAQDVILQRGFADASVAYNSGIDRSNGDILVFAHQDVYLPEGWIRRVESAIDSLALSDPNWGVLGVWGVAASQQRAGHLYCAGLRTTLGECFDGAREVRVLDEVVLIVRKSSGLRFDERLRGFHMYGSDLCLEAARLGMRSYAISALCIHNTNGYCMLPYEFWRSCFFIRHKWAQELPITTTCIEITRSCWPMIRWNLVTAANVVLQRHFRGHRVPDPRQLLSELIAPPS